MIALVAALSFVELFRYALCLVPSVPPAYVVPDNPVVDIIRKDHGLFRTYALAGEPFRPDSNSLFGIADFRSNDGINAMSHVHFRGIVTGLVGTPGLREAGFKLLDLANVKYYYTSGESLPEGFELLYATPAFRAYRRSSARPRALLFDRAQYIEDRGLDDYARGRETLKLVWDWVKERPGDFDRTLVVHDPSAAEGGAVATRGPRPARIVSYEPERVELDVAGAGGGYLFLSDLYYPGWRASVDGRERRILRSWICFRAVKLEPGDRRVVFEYRPRMFFLGVAVSLIACLVWLAFFVRLTLVSPAGPRLSLGESLVEGVLLLDLLFWGCWTVRHLLS